MDLSVVSDVLDWLRIMAAFYDKIKNEIEKEKDESKREKLLDALQKNDLDKIRILLFSL